MHGTFRCLNIESLFPEHQGCATCVALCQVGPGGYIRAVPMLLTACLDFSLPGAGYTRGVPMLLTACLDLSLPRAGYTRAVPSPPTEPLFMFTHSPDPRLPPTPEPDLPSLQGTAGYTRGVPGLLTASCRISFLFFSPAESLVHVALQVLDVHVQLLQLRGQKAVELHTQTVQENSTTVHRSIS